MGIAGVGAALQGATLGCLLGMRAPVGALLSRSAPPWLALLAVGVFGSAAELLLLELPYLVAILAGAELLAGGAVVTTRLWLSTRNEWREWR